MLAALERRGITPLPPSIRARGAGHLMLHSHLRTAMKKRPLSTDGL
jgi:hypothetical protein